jgi:hypothetical protein
MVMARHRCVISATCTQHAGPRGFTNLMVTRRDSDIELDPHATDACVVRLEDDAAPRGGTGVNPVVAEPPPRETSARSRRVLRHITAPSFTTAVRPVVCPPENRSQMCLNGH